MPASLPRNPELEAAAFANADDHDAWRVYADWLQAQGDARGELILLSLHERGAFLSERRAFEARRKASEQQMLGEWKDWAKQVGAGSVDFHFARGLLEQVSGKLSSLAPHLDSLFEQAPIRKLVLRHCEPADLIAVFGRQPTWLYQLTYLKFESSPELDGHGLAALASNPLPELDGINLGASALNQECCAALASLQTQKLRRVVLTATEIDDDRLAQLLNASTRSQWRKLYLTGNPISSEGIGMLARDRELDRLEQLFLRDIEADYIDLMAIADPNALPGLRMLEVSSTWNSDRNTKQALTARFGAGLHQ